METTMPRWEEGSRASRMASSAISIIWISEFAAPPAIDAEVPATVRADRESELRWRLAFDASAWTAGSAVRWLTTRGELRDIAIEDVSLEHVIRQMYRGATAGDNVGHVE